MDQRLRRKRYRRFRCSWRYFVLDRWPGQRQRASLLSVRTGLWGWLVVLQVKIWIKKKKRKIYDNTEFLFIFFFFRLSCFEANLNGDYYQENSTHEPFRGVIWEHWRGDYSLKSSRMMLRPRIIGDISLDPPDQVYPDPWPPKASGLAKDAENTLTPSDFFLTANRSIRSFGNIAQVIFQLIIIAFM